MRATRGLLLWSLALTALGIVLLLNNFLLLSGFNAGALWPLLLVIIQPRSKSCHVESKGCSFASAHPRLFRTIPLLRHT